jgi:predicted esterase
MRCAQIAVLLVGLAATGARADHLEGTHFDRFTAKDPLGRTITYYLSPPTEKPLPIALWVQGSGCDSQFVKLGEKLGARQQTLLFDAAGGRMRVMVVEKPGVEFLDRSPQPGTAAGCRAPFLVEHTLPRWSQAIEAALDDALSRPGVARTPLLVAGSSEGGIVAARVAAERPVTHVAVLSGGGPSQLFDFVLFARAASERGGSPASREQEVYDAWEKIRADPDSTTKSWKGHPYRRWSSFMASSTMENLMASRARIFLVHGDADKSVPVTSFDMLRAQLVSHGRDVTALRIEGAGHNLETQPAKGYPTEFRDLLGKIVDWAMR